MLEAAALVGNVLFVDLTAAQGHVLQPVKRERVGGQAVAPGAADFLIIGLDARRHVGMGDETHVRLVDPHAESDGREGDDAVLAQKAVLIGVAPRLVEPGVINQRLKSLFGKIFREPFGPGARGAIDNAALSAARAQKTLQLFARLVLGGECQRNIGPVEGMDENLRPGAEQPLGDLGARGSNPLWR